MRVHNKREDSWSLLAADTCCLSALNGLEGWRPQWDRLGYGILAPVEPHNCQFSGSIVTSHCVSFQCALRHLHVLSCQVALWSLRYTSPKKLAVLYLFGSSFSQLVFLKVNYRIFPNNPLDFDLQCTQVWKNRLHSHKLYKSRLKKKRKPS